MFNPEIFLPLVFCFLLMIIGLEKERYNEVRATGDSTELAEVRSPLQAALRKRRGSNFFLDKQSVRAENSITLGKEVIQLDINLWISEVAET